MEADTLDFDETAIEIIPPEPRNCAALGAALCACCRRSFEQEPDDYGICRECIECPGIPVRMGGRMPAATIRNRRPPMETVIVSGDTPK